MFRFPLSRLHARVRIPRSLNFSPLSTATVCRANGNAVWRKGATTHFDHPKPHLLCTLQQRWLSADAGVMEDVSGRVMSCLQQYDKINPESLTLESHFMKDLGLDSLDHVEIIVAIENEFAVEIPDNIAETLLTPQDVIAYVAKSSEGSK